MSSVPAYSLQNSAFLLLANAPIAGQRRPGRRCCSKVSSRHKNTQGRALKSPEPWRGQQSKQRIAYCNLGSGSNGSALPGRGHNAGKNDWQGRAFGHNGAARGKKLTGMESSGRGKLSWEENHQVRNRKREEEVPYRLVDNKKMYVDELDVLALLDARNNLNPINASTYNLAAFLWKKIGAIPAERRHRLLDLLQPYHIYNMWVAAGARYDDEDLFLEDANDMLPDVRVDEPLVPHVWDGRIIGLPLPLGWLDRFQKVFFVGKDDLVYGRVVSGGPILSGLGNTVSPLYFQVKLAQSVRATSQRCDVLFAYEDGQLHLESSGVPAGFPPPRPPVWPFSDGMKDYVRAAGPGVLIGQSWRDGRGADDLPKQFLGEFILIRQRISSSTDSPS